MEPNEQHEIYEKARKRVKQKKRVYYHFVLFLIGSVFLIVLNIFFKVGSQFGEWFKFAIAVWLFIWILHFINVFITHRFFGKEWERKETEKLIEKHLDKSEELERNLIKKGIITPNDKLPESEKKNQGL
ncbi:MAG TPA: 2TM domain-containing protein [Flavobacteriia bacterium]|jgi:amino acid permease|nr:2TM domain-containing protein [Flavobacteriia bacterium]